MSFQPQAITKRLACKPVRRCTKPSPTLTSQSPQTATFSRSQNRALDQIQLKCMCCPRQATIRHSVCKRAPHSTKPMQHLHLHWQTTVTSMPSRNPILAPIPQRSIASLLRATTNRLAYKKVRCYIQRIKRLRLRLLPAINSSQYRKVPPELIQPKFTLSKCDSICC